MAKNPLLQQKYAEGFRDGMHEAKAISAAHFTIKLHRLAELPGIGPKRFQQIVQKFMQELTPEELQEANAYIDGYMLTKKKKGTA